MELHAAPSNPLEFVKPLTIGLMLEQKPEETAEDRKAMRQQAELTLVRAERTVVSFQCGVVQGGTGSGKNGTDGVSPSGGPVQTLHFCKGGRRHSGENLCVSGKSTHAGIVPWAKPHEITKGLQQMTGIGENGVLDFFHKT